MASELIWCLYILKVLLPVMSAVQDSVQTAVETAAQLEVPSHDHDHEHEFALGHSHLLDMEHIEIALFAAIGSIGVKEGYNYFSTQTLKHSSESSESLLKTIKSDFCKIKGVC